MPQLPPKSTVAEALKAAGAAPPPTKRKNPLWTGPQDPGPLGGVTQSLISKFLVDRERFRVYYIEGIQPVGQWNHKTGYGDMWHFCEEALAAGHLGQVELLQHYEPLRQYVTELCRTWRMQQEEIYHWYQTLLRQFPEYVRFWRDHPDVTTRSPVLQEQVFGVPYRLPSSRVVYLRGKWDSVDVCEADGRRWIVLQENKTKGDIKEGLLLRQLKFDLQTMLYLVALEIDRNDETGYLAACQDQVTGRLVRELPIRGVRYNVVRRPFSGGRGNIKRHQPTKSNPGGESVEAFYNRLLNDYIHAEPEYWFMRLDADLLPGDVERFRIRFLDPFLEQLCRWYDYIVKDGMDPFGSHRNADAGGIHWQHPFGVYNVLNEGGATDLDEYLENGSMVGLAQVGRLFPELQ